MSIVFARTRWQYDSYVDFWQLVELSGFPTCFVDEMNLGRNVTYVTTPINGETAPAVQAQRAALTGQAQARVVWWNLERPDAPGSPPLHQVISDVLHTVTHVWVSDRHYAALDGRQQYLTLASHPGLAQLYGSTEPLSIERREHQYDYSHVSYLHGRRVAIHERLRALGLKEAPGSQGATRDGLLRQSKVLINTHQTPASIGEPTRIALAAAYRMPVVSEHLADPYPLQPTVDYLDADADGLPGLVATMVKETYPRRELGNNLFRRLCEERSFRSEVETAVKRIVV